jgi:hypothetical protein
MSLSPVSLRNRAGAMTAALAILFASSLSAAPDFYLRQNDHLYFCGAAKDEQRLDLPFLETYITTRFNTLEILFDSLGARHSGGRAVLLALPSGNISRVPDCGTAEVSRFRQIAALNFGEGGSTGTDGATRPSSLGLPSGPLTEFSLGHGISSDKPAFTAAAQLLGQWNAPAMVTSVDIDARGGSLTALNTTVRELIRGRYVGWTQDDQALPLPKEYAAELGRHGMSAQTLDLEFLRVTGLPEEKYALTIDGDNIQTFAREELEAGINLALLSTPMTRQAAQVLASLLEDFAMQFREAPQSGELRETAAPERSREEIISQLRLRASPRTHDYELQPVGGS